MYAKKSFYVLEMFVWPGGARKSEIHVHNNLAAIQQALVADLSYGGNVYLLTAYGEQINLRTYQEGVETQKINLLPYIRVEMQGFPDAWFDQEGTLRGVKFSDRDYETGYAENDAVEVDSETFIEASAEDDWETRATVDWQAVPVQPLRGNLAQKGDPLEVYSDYTKCEESVGCGRNETEQGEHEDENIDWEQADIARDSKENAARQDPANA